MLRKTLILWFTIPLFQQHALAWEELKEQNPIVISTKRILLENFPDAFNPSIFKFGQNYLLSFRYMPDRYNRPSLSYIGIALLNEAFDLISEPQLLSTRMTDSKTPSHSEDARLFSYRDRIFLIYNDNVDIVSPTWTDRRDMFIAELIPTDRHFTISTPLKLCYEKKYASRTRQKNWIPFEWNDTLLISYMLDPHEVIYPNLYNGACFFHYETFAKLDWNFGPIRGSAPPLLIDGEYLGFFHSGMITSSSSSWDLDLWHYFMGAYTFSANPPFEITKITPDPIIAEGFYTPSYHEKRVVFPGGFAVGPGSLLYVAYGKDDYELWIATIDKEALKSALKPVTAIPGSG